VVDQSRLVRFHERIAQRFTFLTSLIERNPHLVRELTSSASDGGQSSNGTTFFADVPDCRLGKDGSEGSVFVGLYFPKAHSVSIGTVLSNIHLATKVAVKVYHAGVISTEYKVTMSIAAQTRGVIAYLDDFMSTVHQAYIQELGHVDLLEFYSDSYRAPYAPVGEGTRELLMTERLRIVRGLCLAVRELHRHNVVHKDIRMPNVMLMENGTLKICDFGLSRNLIEDQQLYSVIHDRMYNGQPYEIISAIKQVRQKALTEAVQNDIFDEASSTSTPTPETGSDVDDMQKVGYYNISKSIDIFMLGSVVVHAVQGKPAFLSNDEIEQRKEPTIEFDNFFPGAALLKDLVRRMLSHDCRSRPTIDEVLSHPYFQSWAQRRSMIENLDDVLHHDGRPVNNDEFKSAVALLKPVEDSVDWIHRAYVALPDIVRQRFGLTRTPFVFPNNEPHPLPQFHSVVRFCRNLIMHFVDHPESFWEALKEKTAVRLIPALPGDFFYANPCINWLFIAIWEQRNRIIGDINRQKEVIKKKYDEDLAGLKAIQTLVVGLTY